MVAGDVSDLSLEQQRRQISVSAGEHCPRHGHLALVRASSAAQMARCCRTQVIHPANSFILDAWAISRHFLMVGISDHWFRLVISSRYLRMLRDLEIPSPTVASSVKCHNLEPACLSSI